jgi:hypothetical protein
MYMHISMIIISSSVLDERMLSGVYIQDDVLVTLPRVSSPDQVPALHPPGGTYPGPMQGLPAAPRWVGG